MHDCWPPSLVKRHVCWFSTTLLNTCDVNDVGYDEVVALHGRYSVKLQQICLRTWYYSIKHAPWSIGNQREKLLDRCPSIRYANLHCETISAKTSTLSIQHTCRVECCYVTAALNIYACWPSITVTNTAASQREKLFDRRPSIRHDTNTVKLYQPNQLHCQYTIHAV